MAQGSTLYRFKIELSDVGRSIYESLSFRVAMHASESPPFLLTRVLAYILNYEDGLEFSAGLSTPEEPAIRLLDSNGAIAKWIDIGNPTARRIHKASKASKNVLVYTYKDPENLKKEVAGEQVHRVEEIEVFSFQSSFLKELEDVLARDNAWTVIHDEGDLIVTSGERTWMGRVETHRLK